MPCCKCRKVCRGLSPSQPKVGWYPTNGTMAAVGFTVGMFGSWWMTTPNMPRLTGWLGCDSHHMRLRDSHDLPWVKAWFGALNCRIFVGKDPFWADSMEFQTLNPNHQLTTRSLFAPQPEASPTVWSRFKLVARLNHLIFSGSPPCAARKSTSRTLPIHLRQVWALKRGKLN